MIKGIPTNYGIEILNSELKKEVQTYALLGLETPKDPSLEAIIAKEDISYDEVKDSIFYTNTIDVGYFDESGILTYEINLQNINTDKYMYALILLDTQNKIVAALPTPQVILIEGIGGLLTIKLPIKGAVSEVVFVSSEYVSRAEFEAMKASLKPPEVNIDELVEKVTPLIQQKKDTLEYAHKILDECINHCKFLLLYKRDNKRDDSRIGEYRLFFRNALPQGYKPLGSILNAAQYPKAYLFFKNTYPKLQENCPRGYFRLPKAGLYAKGTANPQEAGCFMSEGLPNITGGAYTIAETWQSSGWSSGVFNKLGGYNGAGTPKTTDWSNSAAFDFNASRSSGVYGRSSSVEVNHNLFLEGIYVGGG